jgi:hypothetical protein
MIALYRAIGVIYLHDVCMIVKGVEGAHQEEEEPSHHHVVQETFLPRQLLHHCKDADAKPTSKLHDLTRPPNVATAL